MESSRIEFLNKFNPLVKSAGEGSKDFVNRLCEYIAEEFKLDGIVIFKFDDDENLKVLGKSSTVNKFITNSININEKNSCNRTRICWTSVSR